MKLTLKSEEFFIKGIIYKATNKINGHGYIGYAVNGLEGRKLRHKNSANREDGYYFHRAIKKYGLDNFCWITLEQNVTDFEVLKELEIYWIREFGTKRPNGYNLTDGGGGILGYKHTKETKRKIGIGNKGKIRTEEQKRNNGEKHKGNIPWNKGKINCFSEDAREKNRISHIGLFAGEKHPMYGKHHTNEAKQKNSDKHSLNYIVICPDGSIIKVNNLKKFSIENGLNPHNMSSIANGNIHGRKTCGGYKVQKEAL